MSDTDQLRRRQDFGHRLRADRGDLTQLELTQRVEHILGGAETLGQGMVSRYEAGKAVPSTAKLRALAEALHVDVQDYQRLLHPEVFGRPGQGRVRTVDDVLADHERRLRQLEQLLERAMRRPVPPPSS